MNFRRGLFRLWITASAIWFFAAGYTLWPLEIPLERQWPPDVSFCHEELTEILPRVPVAVCERRYRELVLKEWERLGI